MRQIEWTNQFKRDYRREKKGRHARSLDPMLMEIIALLAADEPLAERYRDHALTGEWKDFRDSHIRPDLMLIYQKPNEQILRLVRVGSHSELGL